MAADASELDRFSMLVERVYEGALYPDVWPQVLHDLADWLRVKSCLLFTPLNPQHFGGVLFSHGFTERALELWRTRYQPHDVWSQRALEGNMVWQGNVMLGSELASREQLRGSVWYREFLKPIDIPQLMSTIIFDGQTPGTLTTVYSVFRGEAEPEFDQSDLHRFRLLLPHLSRALGVMFRLREADMRQAASLAALDRLTTGVLLVSASADVVFANRSARQIAENEDGLRLLTRPGKRSARLAVAEASLQRRIDEAIRRCIDGDVANQHHFGMSVRVPRPSGKQALALQFSALPESNEFTQDTVTPRAIVFISDAGVGKRVNPRTLSELFGLTAAEARLAGALVDGDELAETAAQLGIGINTAKSQLQSIYAKTGADNRAKLTRLLVSIGEPDS